MTISQAHAALKAKMPGAFCIGLDLWDHGQGPSPEWDIWCAVRNARVTQPTLDAAVAAALSTFTSENGNLATLDAATADLPNPTP